MSLPTETLPMLTYRVGEVNSPISGICCFILRRGVSTLTNPFTRGSAPDRARSADLRPGSFKPGHEKRGGRKRGTPNCSRSITRRRSLRRPTESETTGMARMALSAIFRGSANVTRRSSIPCCLSAYCRWKLPTAPRQRSPLGRRKKATDGFKSILGLQARSRRRSKLFRLSPSHRRIGPARTFLLAV